MNNKIYVVTHKDYKMPKDDLYQAIAVGDKKKITIPAIRDDSGENIAFKNSQYSELTALYWIWKNSKYEKVGLVHYRRYFAIKEKQHRKILNDTQVNGILNEYDIILTKPRFYIEGVAKHYINCHKTQHERCRIQVSILGDVVKDLHPKYYETFNSVMKKHSAHMFNMFIMRKELLDQYCEWLFPILFEAEKRIEKKNVSYERLMGSLSEFLLDVWVVQNKLNIKNVDLYQTEMDFWKRVKRFLYRRFFEKG